MKNQKIENQIPADSQPNDRVADSVLQQGVDELNLAELPIALLDDTTKAGYRTTTRQQRKDRRRDMRPLSPLSGGPTKRMPRKREQIPMSFEIHDWVTDPLTKERQPRTWIVTGSDKYGLPIASDDEVVIGLLQLTRRKDATFVTREIPLSRYELCREMGWVPDQHNYSRIKEAFDRLMGVTIYTDRFWDARGKKYVQASFHILDNYYLYDQRAARQKHQSALDLSRILWNEVLLQSFQRGGLKYLNTQLWRSWKRPVTRRLHRYLDKHRYWKLEWRIDLFDLGSLLNLPPSQRHYAKDIKKYVDRAAHEMILRGYLASVSFERHGYKQEAVFRFADSPTHTSTRGAETDAEGPADIRGHIEGLVNQFYKSFHGVDHLSPLVSELKLARTLIDQYGIERAQFIVEFSKQAAGETNYQPQTFRGIRHYVSRAIAAYDQAQARKKMQDAIERCEICDRSGFISFSDARGNTFTTNCPHDLKKVQAREQREGLTRI